jgi:hypothetical protein
MTFDNAGHTLREVVGNLDESRLFLGKSGNLLRLPTKTL